jgi:hypothetical protein
MNKQNANSDFYEHLYESFIDYLAIDFFLSKNEEPSQEPDLLKFIHTNSRDCEFIEYLILNIHRLVFVENSSDEMKTAVSMHLQKKTQKCGTKEK